MVVGALLLVLGLATALFGVIFATVQTDMKRLLAYSSIENIGLIVVGFGLTLIFKSFMLPHLAALALTATLYHCLNHAFFKSLLFLCHRLRAACHARTQPWQTRRLRSIACRGSVAGTDRRTVLGRPATAQRFRFRMAAIAKLPVPLPGLPQGYLNMLLPVVAGAVALIAALAGFAMVKFFGIVFLGQPREETLAHAHAGRLERIGLLWLGVGCILLGLSCPTSSSPCLTPSLACWSIAD